ncbi:MOSC domain-containing protein [Pseudomarimonas arenosa]|uniref:MOSC domain-containing protein n=1 Tax=Pseudomarimonas arenosa TaxID=2774145 RepID=A0AAW3ZM48_9GAMM|nr:MOSC N-terminal beta barrel domain-containing protein [Pseudomarimonas arenosa]MBD8526257.1 MOSC domain-containing protein [Pseudomarimonas arenosa]
MHVSQLFIHPLKSAAGLSLESMLIEPRGPQHDRRWMLIDDNGRFVSGRELGALVKLSAIGTTRGLQLAWQGETLQVPRPANDAPRYRVSLWKDEINAALAEPAAHGWLSQRLQRPVRLVYMDEQAARPADPKYADPRQEVSFADGFPLLLVSEAAVEEVNQKAGGGIDARRFRPNIVVSGCAAHAEDSWKRLRIGELEFHNVKPCVRCVFTTVDADSGERDPRGEPLRSLKEYRRSERGITFGVNLIAVGAGRIALGNRVTVLE